MRRWMNRAAVGLVAAIVLSGTVFAAFGMNAGAAKSDYDDDDFTIDMDLSMSAGKDAYDVGIEIANDGPDFEGTVRVIVENAGSATCAYDTMISLAEGGKKQFSVSIPVTSLDLSYYNHYGQAGTLYVILLDDKGNTVTTEKNSRLFQYYQDKVSIGILSDDDTSLEYLGVNGLGLYILNNTYQIELVELSKDTLADKLDADGLDYLVIDQYDTSVLDEDTVAEIENWTDQGGMLILGTGKYAYDVLGGFDPQFLQTECLGIYDSQTMDFETENGVSADMYNVTGSYSPYDYYGVTIDMYLPSIYETDTAILSGFSQYDGNYHYNVYGSSVSSGRGSITYLYYALSDPEVADASAATTYAAEDLLNRTLDQTMWDRSTFHQENANGGIHYTYNLSNALGIIDMEKSGLNYSFLKVLIVIYVILVGPVIYLILRRLKKRELYWIAVPTLALLFVGIVSIAGRGFKIADTTVCSVTFIDAGDSGEAGSVLYAYSADHDDWQISLAEECAYAGPLQGTYGWTSDPLDYYYHVTEDMSGTSVGIRPSASFETTMFCRKAADPVEGELLAENIEVSGSRRVKGYVTNETGYDFSYMLIFDNGSFAVVEGIEDGEKVDLADLETLLNDHASSMDDVLWLTAEQEYEEDKNFAAQLAALYIGLFQTADFQETAVIGVVPDYERVTEGNYNETSYGVFCYVPGIS